MGIFNMKSKKKEVKAVSPASSSGIVYTRPLIEQLPRVSYTLCFEDLRNIYFQNVIVKKIVDDISGKAKQFQPEILSTIDIDSAIVNYLLFGFVITDTSYYNVDLLEYTNYDAFNHYFYNSKTNAKPRLYLRDCLLLPGGLLNYENSALTGILSTLENFKQLESLMGFCLTNPYPFTVVSEVNADQTTKNLIMEDVKRKEVEKELNSRNTKKTISQNNVYFSPVQLDVKTIDAISIERLHYKEHREVLIGNIALAFNYPEYLVNSIGTTYNNLDTAATTLFIDNCVRPLVMYIKNLFE